MKNTRRHSRGRCLRRLTGSLLAIACTLVGMVAGAAARAAEADVPSAVIIAYHRFGESDKALTNVSLPAFEAHLQHLEREGFHVLPVPEIVRALRDSHDLPPRTVGITIDDGYRSAWTEGAPRLSRFGFPFTLFLITDYLDQDLPDNLTWDEVRALQAQGASPASHTAGHEHLAGRDEAEIRDRLATAMARLKDETGTDEPLLAWPYGETSNRLMRIAEDMGHLGAFGTQSGAIGPEASRFHLPRFLINQHREGLDRFRTLADALPLRATVIAPADLAVKPQDTPLPLTFRVGETVGSLDRLTCYDRQGNRLRYDLRDREVSVAWLQPTDDGLRRINCTLQAGSRWRWFGHQVLVRPDS